MHISLSYLSPAEQLLQFTAQQLQIKMVQKYQDRLHPTPEVGHNSKGQLIHHQVASHLERYRPEGSRRDGTCAATKALCMILLTAEWQWWHPTLLLQLKPCVAN